MLVHFVAVWSQYYGSVAPKLQAHASLGSGYSSVAYVACGRLLLAFSKPAWATRSRAEKLCKRKSLLGLVAAATHEFDWAGRAEESVKASPAWAGRIGHRTRI